MDLSRLNYIAILVAALSSFLIGGIWYSPWLFVRGWMEENSLTDERLRQGNTVKIFAVSFLLSLIISVNLAAFLTGPPDLAWGLIAGALAGIGWVATSLGIIYLFERKSLRLFFINAGYLVVSFIVMGGILGVWK